MEMFGNMGLPSTTNTNPVPISKYTTKTVYPVYLRYCTTLSHTHTALCVSLDIIWNRLYTHPLPNKHRQTQNSFHILHNNPKSQGWHQTWIKTWLTFRKVADVKWNTSAPSAVWLDNAHYTKCAHLPWNNDNKSSTGLLPQMWPWANLTNRVCVFISFQWVKKG